jgi:hypothetical protein
MVGVRNIKAITEEDLKVNRYTKLTYANTLC